MKPSDPPPRVEPIEASPLQLTPEQEAKKAARAAHTRAAIATHKARRARRLDDLIKAAPTLDKVLDQYRLIDSKTNDPVLLPRGFIALSFTRPASMWEELVVGEKPDLAEEFRTRPPMTRLVRRDRHSISFLLTMLYVAQQETRPGSVYRNNRPNHVIDHATGLQPWAALAGFRVAPTPRARRARLVRSLQALHGVGIVAPRLRGTTNVWEGFDLRSADGEDKPTVALTDESDADKAIAIPSSFFYQGWHLVLTPSELVMFLAIVHQTALHPKSTNGVGFPIATRRGLYGISDEVYQSIHALEEFGLIEIKDTMEGRNRGKIKMHEPGDPEATRAPEPYRIIYPATDSVLDQNQAAHYRVHRYLKLFPAPTRLSEEVNLDGFAFNFVATGEEPRVGNSGSGHSLNG